jgi:3-isopropylmalate/(R)-2-methylmalate dehydratase small subunit
MEIAVTVILAAGIRAVVAESFSRTFFRNAINNGLLAVTCDTSGIAEGDQLLIEAGDDAARVTNQARRTVLTGAPLPRALRGIVSAGGLVPYVRRFGRLPAGAG